MSFDPFDFIVDLLAEEQAPRSLEDLGSEFWSQQAQTAAADAANKVANQ